MRSENEAIHYRARFEIYSKQDGADILGGVASIMLEWFARKEKNLARRDADVFSKSHQLNAKMVRALFSEGGLELPDGYDGGVGREGRSSVCTKSIIDEQGELKCWAFEYDEPDARERFRHWHTSVGVSRQTGEKRCVVNIRITYDMMPGFIGKPPSTPPSTTPRFVRSIIEASGWAVCVGDTEVLREERYLDAKNLSVSDFMRVTEAGSLQTIKELTKAGCGITFLYEAAVRRELEDGSLRQIPLRDFPVVHEYFI